MRRAEAHPRTAGALRAPARCCGSAQEAGLLRFEQPIRRIDVPPGVWP